MYFPHKKAPLGDLERSASARSASKTPAQIGYISNGYEGMRDTLRVMRDFARQAVRSPEQIIRNKAEDLTRHLPARNWFAEIKALHEFVRDDIRYLRDPVNLERVATPETTLETGQGDCDDKATLLAALLESIGHPARFVAVALDHGPFSHVLVETQAAHNWVPLETIIPRPVGWFPDGVTSAYRLKV